MSNIRTGKSWPKTYKMKILILKTLKKINRKLIIWWKICFNKIKKMN